MKFFLLLTLAAFGKNGNFACLFLSRYSNGPSCYCDEA